MLTQFESAGLVLKHNFEGGRAVLRTRPRQHHDHMVDVDSGKVIEFHSGEIEAVAAEDRAQHGYVIGTTRWCCTCAKEAPVRAR